MDAADQRRQMTTAQYLRMKLLDAIMPSGPPPQRPAPPTSETLGSGAAGGAARAIEGYRARQRRAMGDDE